MAPSIIIPRTHRLASLTVGAKDGCSPSSMATAPWCQIRSETLSRGSCLRAAPFPSSLARTAGSRSENRSRRKAKPSISTSTWCFEARAETLKEELSASASCRPTAAFVLRKASRLSSGQLPEPSSCTTSSTGGRQRPTGVSLEAGGPPANGCGRGGKSAVWRSASATGCSITTPGFTSSRLRSCLPRRSAAASICRVAETTSAAFSLSAPRLAGGERAGSKRPVAAPARVALPQCRCTMAAVTRSTMRCRSEGPHSHTTDSRMEPSL
mmetsp:Transcript_25829/g.72329  ORF Transcript_25829/g.72329 Transcript_25829/m.72329 type:complete len:268 (+) Transcript_25829:377-1180(+)